MGCLYPMPYLRLTNVRLLTFSAKVSPVPIAYCYADRSSVAARILIALNTHDVFYHETDCWFSTFLLL